MQRRMKLRPSNKTTAMTDHERPRNEVTSTPPLHPTRVGFSQITTEDSTAMAAVVEIGYGEGISKNHEVKEDLSPVEFYKLAKFPAPKDNCAIATRTIEAGTRVLMPNGIDIYTISHQVLEGHRFAGTMMKNGDTLYSWGLPFGVMIVDVVPGTYLVNNTMIVALQRRNIVICRLPTLKTRLSPMY